MICFIEFPQGTESMVGMDIWTVEQTQLHAVKNTNHVDQEMALTECARQCSFQIQFELDGKAENYIVKGNL